MIEMTTKSRIMAQHCQIILAQTHLLSLKLYKLICGFFVNCSFSQLLPSIERNNNITWICCFFAQGFIHPVVFPLILKLNMILSFFEILYAIPGICHVHILRILTPSKFENFWRFDSKQLLSDSDLFNFRHFQILTLSDLG